MGQDEIVFDDAGLQVLDAVSTRVFVNRPPRKHSVSQQMEAMDRIAKSFAEDSSGLLQELVDTAVMLTGADSAGISLQKPDATDEKFYHWVATAGEYTPFLNAELPKYPSACSITLERGQPQLFRVGQKFFDIMGISAPLVTDGILLPWTAGDMRGTIFVMAHGRTEAFDEEDARTMQVLANFATMATNQQRQRQMLMLQERAGAAAAMANDLAHKINNPLQSLTNLLYLASAGAKGEPATEVGQQAMVELERLSALVGQLLKLPLSK